MVGAGDRKAYGRIRQAHQSPLLCTLTTAAKAAPTVLYRLIEKRVAWLGTVNVYSSCGGMRSA